MRGSQSDIISSEGAWGGDDPDGSLVVQWSVICRHEKCLWSFPGGQVVILEEPLFGVGD